VFPNCHDCDTHTSCPDQSQVSRLAAGCAFPGSDHVEQVQNDQNRNGNPQQPKQYCSTHTIFSSNCVTKSGTHSLRRRFQNLAHHYTFSPEVSRQDRGGQPASLSEPSRTGLGGRARRRQTALATTRNRQRLLSVVRQEIHCGRTIADFPRF
jgi:hypothetical protein